MTQALAVGLRSSSSGAEEWGSFSSVVSALHWKDSLALIACQSRPFEAPGYKPNLSPLNAIDPHDVQPRPDPTRPTSESGPAASMVQWHRSQCRWPWQHNWQIGSQSLRRRLVPTGGLKLRGLVPLSCFQVVGFCALNLGWISSDAVKTLGGYRFPVQYCSAD